MSLVHLATFVAKMITDQMRKGQTDGGRKLIQLDPKLIDTFEQEMIAGIELEMSWRLPTHDSLGTNGLGHCVIYCNPHCVAWRSIELPAEAIGLTRDKIYDYVPDTYLQIKENCLYRIVELMREELITDETIIHLSEDVAQLVKRMSDKPLAAQCTTEQPENMRASELVVDQQFSLKEDGTIYTVISIKSITPFALQLEARCEKRIKKFDLSSDAIVYPKK